MREKQRLWGLLAHASIIVGMMIVAFFTADLIRPQLGFSTSVLGRWLTLALALCAIGNGLYSAALLYRRQKRHEEKSAASPSRARPTPAIPDQNGIAFDARKTGFGTVNDKKRTNIH